MYYKLQPWFLLPYFHIVIHDRPILSVDETYNMQKLRDGLCLILNFNLFRYF